MLVKKAIFMKLPLNDIDTVSLSWITSYIVLLACFSELS